MKKIITVLFLFSALFAFGEEDAGYELGNYKIKGDSIYLEDGDVYALEEFYVDHPELRNYIEGKEKLKQEIEKDKEENNFIGSWKFYLLIFIFPVILLFFLILFLKTRKKD